MRDMVGHAPTLLDRRCAGRVHKGDGTMEEGGYSGTFYVMLIIGIVGVLGFFIVAAGAAGGM